MIALASDRDTVAGNVVHGGTGPVHGVGLTPGRPRLWRLGACVAALGTLAALASAAPVAGGTSLAPATVRAQSASGPGSGGAGSADTARAGVAATVALGVDTVRVGDPVPVTVRVPFGPGERVVWPDTLPLAGSRAENAARVRSRIDTLPVGRREAVAVYAVTPWRTGELPLPALEVGVVAGDESVSNRSVPLPALDVLSVLPEDTAGIQPKPAKGVVGPSWAWTTILMVVLALVAAVGALVWWLRRRAGETVGVEPLASPRERALARLDAALEAGLPDGGPMKPFYTRVAHAVRGYLAELDGAWGEDLTTTELLGRFRRQAGAAESARLAELLRPADQVKFARREPDAATARVEWQRARDWVERFDWPPPPRTEAAA